MDKEMQPSEMAQRIADNDATRSEFIWRLLCDAQQRKPLKNSSLIPQNIVQFWDSKYVPRDVEENLESWASLKSKGFKYSMFDRKEARNFITAHYPAQNADAFDACYHPAMESDYFRLCYLWKRGGIYVDADDHYIGGDLEPLLRGGLGVQPLCYDCISQQMTDVEQLLKSSAPPPEKIFYFNNNPLLAPPHHQIIGLALRRATNLLTIPSTDRYPEIQSTTGPGNLTNCIVRSLFDDQELSPSLNILFGWSQIAQTVWDLSYRRDERNWRLSNGTRFEENETRNES